MDSFLEAIQQLAEVSREYANWKCDEQKNLRIGVGDAVTKPLSAEVRHKPVFGFRPSGFRADVRITIPKTEIPEGEAKQGISLYEGEDLFGNARSWQLKYAIELSDGGFDVWLEN